MLPVVLCRGVCNAFAVSLHTYRNPGHNTSEMGTDGVDAEVLEVALIIHNEVGWLRLCGQRARSQNMPRMECAGTAGHAELHMVKIQTKYKQTEFSSNKA